MRAGRHRTAAANHAAGGKYDAKFLPRHCNLMTRHRARTPDWAAPIMPQLADAKIGGGLPEPVRACQESPDETIASTRRTTERRRLAFLILMKARTNAWPSALPRKSVI